MESNTAALDTVLNVLCNHTHGAEGEWWLPIIAQAGCTLYCSVWILTLGSANPTICTLSMSLFRLRYFLWAEITLARTFVLLVLVMVLHGGILCVRGKETAGSFQIDTDHDDVCLMNWDPHVDASLLSRFYEHAVYWAVFMNLPFLCTKSKHNIFRLRPSRFISVLGCYCPHMPWSWALRAVVKTGWRWTQCTGCMAVPFF